MGLSVGNDLKLYYNTGTDASPVWVPIEKIGDVTVNLNLGEAEIDLRLSNWLLNLPTKLSGSIDLTLAADISGTVWEALRGFYFGRTQAQFASASAAIATTGTEYFKAFCFFSTFPWNQPTQELTGGDASLSLGYTEESSALVEPSWAVVSA